MMYKLMAVDLDGTLLTDDKRIDAPTAEAVGQALERGFHFAVATGRAWPGVRRYAKEIHLTDPVVTMNGAMIVNPVTEEILYSQPISHDDALRLLNMGYERGVTQVIWCRNRLYGTLINDRMRDYSTRFGGGSEILPADDFEKLASDGISKVLWCDEPEKVNEYVRMLNSSTFESLSACTSEPYFAEIFNAKVSKADSLRILCSMLGISTDEMIAVGDGCNDIPMIRLAGLGVAMGNASQTVKDEASEIALTNGQNAIGVLLQKYVIGGQNG